MVLKEVFSRGFTHQAQSLRVVDLLEKNGRGLNLSDEVRDGIFKHSKGYGKIMPEDPAKLPYTMEGRVVRFADIMAYLNHDLDDAIRSRVISRDDVPAKCLEIIGESHSERATRMISDLIHASEEGDGYLEFRMSDAMFDAMIALRKFLYTRVYRAPRVHAAFVKAKKILADLYRYFLENEEPLYSELAEMEMENCHKEGVSREQVVCDCIASMTDQRALRLYERIFFPAPSGKRLLQ
jgi:dGTPase